MATSTMAADASAGASAAEIEAAFLAGAEDGAFDASGAHGFAGDGGAFGDAGGVNAGDRADDGAYPSDEAILGIEDGLCSPPRGVGAGNFRGDISDLPQTSGAGARENRSRGADGLPKAPPLRHGAGYTGQNSDDPRSGDADSADVRGGVGGVADGAATPAMPEWLAQLGANAPSASAELGALWQRATQLDAFDRAYYGDDAGAQQELVSALYAENPGALRAMFAAAANVLHGGAGTMAQNGAKGGRVAQGLGPAVFPRRGAGAAIGDGFGDAEESGGQKPQVQGPALHNRPRMGHAEEIARNEPGARAGNAGGLPQAAQTNANAQGAAREASRNSGLAANAAQHDVAGAQGGAQHANAGANGAARFDAGAYAQFERATNDAVVSDVTRAIEHTLDHALPAGIADGARRRIAGDTLNEVHAALRGDRQLSAQVSEALRTGRFDDAAREQVSRLIASRARGVVPAAAKRVIGEWTGSVLATHRERAAKQQSTQSRVDITGGGLPQPVPRRTVRPSDVDYRATSDEEILSW